MKKLFNVFLLSLCCFLSAFECGPRSLVFLSTGRLEPGHQPSFEQLTLFDGVPVSHCEGLTRTEKFKPALESKNLPTICEMSCVDLVESLYEIPRLINTTVYVVQRRRGCVHSANKRDSAFDAWSVNGKDFVTFDPDSQRWTSQSMSAGTVKQTWDKKRERNVAFSQFIKKECPELMDRIRLRPTDLKTDVNIFAKPMATMSQALLICHVTSTDRSTSSLHLSGAGSSASSAIRMTVSRPLPGPGDGSVVLRLTAQISFSQLPFTCTVQTARHNISVVWDGKTLDGRPLLQESRVAWKMLTIILGVLAVALTVAITSCATICLLKCVKMKSRPLRPPGPQVVVQFSAQDITSPDLQSVIISLIQGSQTNREIQEEWEQKMRRRDQDYYDPDYFPRRGDGVNT